MSAIACATSSGSMASMRDSVVVIGVAPVWLAVVALGFRRQGGGGLGGGSVGWALLKLFANLHSINTELFHRCFVFSGYLAWRFFSSRIRLALGGRVEVGVGLAAGRAVNAMSAATAKRVVFIERVSLS
jgi:hypothetical protein